jgi:CO/xanthine dehydrogenase Mo-binding subunit
MVSKRPSFGPPTDLHVKSGKIHKGGIVASTAAVINAIVDALGPFGATDVPMPATPDRIRHAIEERIP